MQTTTGNLFLLDFDPGPGSFNMISAGVYDAFVLKLSNSSIPLQVELVHFTSIQNSKNVQTNG